MTLRTRAYLRRGVIFGATGLSTVLATAELARLLGVKGHTTLEYLLLVLFALNFSWISLSFWSGVAGFLVLLRGKPSTGLVWPTAGDPAPLRQRTAIVVPVYNEDPRGVFGRIEAMVRSLERTGEGGAFDFYVLSDTQVASLWPEEEREWAQLCARVGGAGRVFYRRRAQNLHRKSGNVADFVRRWGGAYPFFVVLDADSLMSGTTLVSMARLMELNPQAGILQVPPVLVGPQTLFARLQQFATASYGPVNAAGLAYWQLGDSNYWGHNAILRTAAFAKHCGLPVLPGRSPFGGEILSHDFVEAALIRRGGYSVWLVPELGGSYEQPPPTLIDYAQRDRRWCQGNLQHLPLIFSAQLHPMSRLHFALGVMSYVASPLCLLFLCIGLGAAVHDKYIDPQYFGPYRTLFPRWPTFETESAIRLAFLCLSLLLVPKVLGVGLLLAKGKQRGLAAVRTVLSALLETVWSLLSAPIFMVLQSLFVITTVAGHTVTWSTQRRDDRSTPWAEAWERHRGHTGLGVSLAAVAIWGLPSLLPWLAPLAIGLTLSVPLSVLSSRPSWGRRLRDAGLLLTEEEARPEQLLREAHALTHPGRALAG